LWYSFREYIRRKTAVNRSVAFLCIVLVTATGHFGGNLTHGEDFLFAPFLNKEEDAPVAFDDALVNEHMVKPILRSKCISCHNPRKAKGELVMETPELLLKGGKSGSLWDSTAKDFGLFLKRVHLPLADEDHMPPKGKPQLTGEELVVLEAWIRAGSD